MKTKFSQVLACALAAIMLIGVMPLSAFAAETSSNSLTIASKSTSQLAPGVTETAVVSYDKNGDRIQYWVVNANVKDYDTVQIKANYHDNDNTGNWGKATVIEQANAATEKRGYNVVVSQNAAYYNVTTGQPTGAFVMEGVNINGNATGNQYEFFAQMDDGSYMIGKKGTFSQYSEHITEAIAGHLLLVWDGKVIAGLDNTAKYPRSTIGITAEGNVVCMLADGNQKPISAGLSYAEQAQLMLELGCVAAIELDGGGSATYASKYEGETELSVRNNCCDGTVRSVSNTFMIISTAVADGVFDHANLSTEYAYYTPYSKVTINATGADKGGHAAELPDDVSWTLSDDTFGTIANGVLTSSGKCGTVTVKLQSGDATVGSIDVTFTHPTEISFAAEEKMIPYGKPSDFTVTALYNGASIYATADAFDFNCTAGTMNGFVYTAPAEGTATTATVSASYKYDTSVNSPTVAITFGKGSDVLFDFEDGIDGWGDYYDLVEAKKKGEYTGDYTVIYEPEGALSNTNLVNSGIHENVFLATEENGGKVHSGDKALGYTLDYRYSQSYANWLYSYLYFWGDPITLLDTKNGVAGARLGMWMYIPEEAVGSCARFCYTYKQADGTLNTAYLYFTYMYVEKGFSKLTSEKIPEAGWAYVYVDMKQISDTYVSTAYYKDADGNLTRVAPTNYAPAFIQFIISSSATGAEKVTFYIDDITLDYSDAVDDRDAPIISNPLVLDDLNSYAIDGRTINFNTLTVTADAIEDIAHGTNYTGLDESTAQVYIDGQKVTTTFATGKISATGIKVPNGTHDVTFEIADKQGNYTKLTKQIVVDAQNDIPTVTLTGAPTAVNSAGNMYTGGQYDMYLKTDAVEGIDKVNFKLWLNSASKWSLENMSVLSGFAVTYTLDENACMADITVTRVNSDAKGSATLLTIPVYAWSWNAELGLTSASNQWNKNGAAPQITVSYKVKYGKIEYTDTYAVDVAGFSNVRTDVKTELNSSIKNLKESIGEWHYHTESALNDKAATCTEDGFTGRTQCSVCKSVMNWGTVEKATGHSYAFAENVLQCTECEELFNGVYTDGKTYVNGVLQADGWVGESYYKNGEKLTGIQLIDGYYYDFGDSGICTDKAKYTGLFEQNGNRYYAVVGSLMAGWQQIGTEMYYFDPTTYAGINGKYTSYEVVPTSHYFEYSFTNGKLDSGAWSSDASGTRYYYGPTFVRGWQTIDGNVYYMDVLGYRYENMHRMETGTYSGIFKWYNFTSEGIYLGICEGVCRIADDVYYLVDGEPIYAGLVKDTDGSYYYISGNGCKAIKNTTYYITKTNDLLPVGTYKFGEDGKMIIKQGVVKDADGEIRYYVDGQAIYAGLVKDTDGSYYYISGNGCIALKNRTYYITKTNDLLPVGTYKFGEDGKMIIKQGVVKDTDGEIRYYVDGQAIYAGLVKDTDGSYYYISGNGCIALKNRTYYITKTNDLLPVGTYKFGEDGKMIIKQGVVKDADGEIRYYVDGQAIYAGLVKDTDGSYYYISGNGCIALKNRTYYVAKTNGLLPAGNYTFGADGKMITD